MVKIARFPNGSVFIIYSDLNHENNSRERWAGCWTSLVKLQGGEKPKEAENPPERFGRYSASFATPQWQNFKNDPLYVLQIKDRDRVEKKKRTLEVEKTLIVQ